MKSQKARKQSVVITEKSLQQEIMWKLRAMGWLVLRLPPSIYSSQGLPDLLAIKGSDYMLIEVKSQKGRLSRKQVLFHILVEQVNGNIVVARSWEDVKNYLNQKGNQPLAGLSKKKGGIKGEVFR